MLPLPWKSTQHAYSRLRKDQIRLLHIERDAPRSSLHFTVHTFERESAPVYAAVSYTWGSGSADKPIFLGGLEFLVRPGLWWCLRNLQTCSQYLYFWVDAICINQDDVQERSEQVAVMDEIYANAAGVYAWLGLEYHPQSWADYEPHSSSIADYEVFVYEFANRPYWSRMWVIQELLLARKVWVVCGPYCMTWNEFTSLLYPGLSSSAIPSAAHNDDLGARPFIICREPNFNRSLYELLLKYHGSGCKDPRDKVFALMGLLPTEERLELSKFFPDYSLTEDDFVLMTLAHLIRWADKEITEKDHELFTALGVDGNKKRRMLIQLAHQLDPVLETRDHPSAVLHILQPFEKGLSFHGTRKATVVHGADADEWVKVLALELESDDPWMVGNNTSGTHDDSEMDQLFELSGLCNILPAVRRTVPRRLVTASVSMPKLDPTWETEEDEFDTINDILHEIFQCETEFGASVQKPSKSSVKQFLPPKWQHRLSASQDRQHPYTKTLDSVTGGSVTRARNRVQSISKTAVSMFEWAELVQQTYLTSISGGLHVRTTPSKQDAPMWSMSVGRLGYKIRGDMRSCQVLLKYKLYSALSGAVSQTSLSASEDEYRTQLAYFRGCSES